MRPRLRRAITAILVLAAGAAALHLTTRPQGVLTHTVGEGEVLAEVLGTGAIEARRAIDLGFEVTGRVVRLGADQGDPVRAGQELAAVGRRGKRCRPQESILAPDQCVALGGRRHPRSLAGMPE